MRQKLPQLSITYPNALAWEHLGIPPNRLRSWARKAECEYRPYVDRGKEKEREIDNPSEGLKSVQKAIQRKLFSPLDLPFHIHGCARGRSPKSNAKLHVRSPMLVKLDIVDCYHSITRQQVFATLRAMGCSRDVARLLTRLTTFDGSLPVGAPTSPALANLVLLHGPDQELLAVAAQRELRFSRYVDDVAFSGERAVTAIRPAVATLRRHGFRVSHRKLSLASRAVRQAVTGLTVNEKVNLPRSFHKRLRALEHIAKNLPTPAARGAYEVRINGHVSYRDSILGD